MATVATAAGTRRRRTVLVIFEGGQLAAKESGGEDQDNSPSFEGQRANAVVKAGHEDCSHSRPASRRGVAQSFGRATAAGSNRRTCETLDLIVVEVRFSRSSTRVKLNALHRAGLCRWAVTAAGNDGA